MDIVLFFGKKKLIILLAILTVLMPPAYNIINIANTLPDKLTLFKGQTCTINIGSMIESNIKSDGLSQVSTNAMPFAKKENDTLVLESGNIGKYSVELKLMGVIPVKDIDVDVQNDAGVIPCGNAVGIKIHTEGVLVIAISYAEDKSGSQFTPAKDAGLKPGDVITTLNGESVVDAGHFSSIVEHNGTNMLEVGYMRAAHKYTAEMYPTLTRDGYKVGAWVRDSTAGIGTVTFIKPDTGIFAALGHGISDVDTGQLLTVSKGSITECTVESILTGKKGTPGELKGVFTDNELGVILENSPVGLYGAVQADKFPYDKTVKIATRFEIQEGPAQILCSLDGQGVKNYDIVIEKVMTKSSDGKGMVIRMTDPELLAQTGGIVQGMSGSPIMQGGKLVGAVTHVFVNDPTHGYGIFIELMMDKASQLR